MECPHIPIISYNEFSSRIQNKIAGKHIPITGSMEVTARCNLACIHCYINLPAGDKDALKRELTTDECKNVLDQLAGEGCLWLLLTGGEPFIRPDFMDIYSYAIKKGLLITLFTNGTMITPKIADYLAELTPYNLEVTLYGNSQNIYERVTGIPGSFKKCINGIELLLERNIPLRLKTVVLEINKHELWSMQNYAEKMGLNFRYDPVINVRLDGGRRPSAYRLSAQEVLELDLKNEKRKKELSEFCAKFHGVMPEEDFLYQCGAGMHTCHIDSFGRLSACLMARSPSYDLRQGPFKKGWKALMPKIRSQKWSTKTPCTNCDLIALCDQCPGWGLLEHGNPESKVSYLCDIAHLRAEAFELERPERDKRSLK